MGSSYASGMAAMVRLVRKLLPARRHGETAMLLERSTPSTGFDSSSANQENDTDPVEETSDGSAPWWQKKRNLLGLFFAVLGAILESSSYCFVQTLHESVPHAELNVFRYCLSPVLAVPLLAQVDFNLRMEHSTIKWFLGYAVFNNFHNLCAFGSMYYVGVGTGAALIMGASIVASWMIGAVVFRSCKLASSVGALLCLAGILMISQPEIMYEKYRQNMDNDTQATKSCFSVCEQLNDTRTALYELISTTSATLMYTELNDNRTVVVEAFNNKGSGSQAKLVFGYVLGFLGGAFDSLSSEICNRRLGNVNAGVLTMWTSLVAVVISLLQMAIFESPTLPGCWFCLDMLVFHSVTASAASFVWTLCVQYIPSLLAFIAFAAMSIPLTQILQTTAMADVQMSLDSWVEYLGASICLCGLMVGPVYELFVEKSGHSREDHL